MAEKIVEIVLPDLYDTKVLRVVMGSQDDYVAQESIETFLSAPYKVSPKANRMAQLKIGDTMKYQVPQ